VTRPVILDTDIGTDIDDTWALAMLLASHELDLRLVTCVSGDVGYRAGLCAGLLSVAGRRDVPIGLGIGGPLKLPDILQGTPQSGFAGADALVGYPQVRNDGVDAIIELIMASTGQVTIIAIGPLTNIAEALRRRPEIAQHANLVGMHGSVRVGYRGASTPSAEYNVFADVAAAQEALSAPWEKIITPLDSCGNVVLQDGTYQRFHAFATAHPGSMAATVLENYRLWLKALGAPAERLTERSTTLYDTVAIYLAIEAKLLQIETLPIRVDDAGFTRVQSDGALMQVATGWRDYDRFEQLLLDRLCW
jgi:inosine-uridine nucleoside N-ribohydrolase